jgi:O-antigen ligase
MFFSVTLATLLANLALGGATQHGFLSDALLQAAALPLLLTAGWRLWESQKSPDQRRALVFCSAIVALPLVQLIPLPPFLWTHLPARASLVSTYALLRRPLTWAPISLAREETWLSALALLPPLALFLAVLTLEWRERRRLCVAVVAFAVASGLIGLLQKAQVSLLQFFETVDASQPLGFFPNQNLLAALLYCGAVMATAWLLASLGSSHSSRRHQKNTTAVAIASALALLSLVSIVLVTRSRAGVVLTFLGVFALVSGTAIRGAGSGNPEDLGETESARWHLDRRAIGAAFAVLLTTAFVFVGWSSLAAFLDRFALDHLTDERPVFAKVTFFAAKAFMPVGAGLGSFIPTYQTFEKPTDLFVVTYANHAHNELLELALEAGVYGLLLLVIFLAWLVKRARLALTAPRAPLTIDEYLRDAGLVTILLCLAHSLVDYPLRTSALASIFAFAGALLFEPPNADGQRSQGHHAAARKARRRVEAAE